MDAGLQRSQSYQACSRMATLLSVAGVELLPLSAMRPC
jgi:hypothetical protein